MLNFKLYLAPHQRLISRAAAAGFAIFWWGEGKAGGYICVHPLSSSYMMKQVITQKPAPFSLLFGSSLVLTKDVRAVSGSQQQI